MFRNILPLIKITSPKILPEWERLSKDIDDRHLPLIMRFLNNELPDVQSVMLLEHTLRICSDEIKEMLWIRDNFERCAYLMEPRRRLFIEQRIDSIRAQSFFINTFFHGTSTMTGTKESIVPIYKYDPLRDLPLQPYKKNLWPKQKAVRYWFFESDQLITDLSSDPRPKFFIPPKVGVITVDFMILLLQLVNWIDTIAWDRESKIPIREFMRDQVFVNTFHDLKENWLLQMIENIFFMETPNEVSSYAKNLHQMRYTKQDYSPYFLDLNLALTGMKRGAIPPEQMLGAKLLGDKSIIDRTKEGFDNLCPSRLRQYDHLTLSIHIRNIKLIALFMDCSGNQGLRRSIGIEIERRIRLIGRTGVHKQYRQVDLSSWLQRELTALLLLAEKMKR